MAKTSSHYVAATIRQARRQGLDVATILAETGIPPELADVEDRWIDNTLLTALVKCLWRDTNDEAMGLYPEPMRMGSWALICDYMRSADTLGDLYRRGERICQYLPPVTLGMSFSVDGQAAQVKIHCDSDRDPDHFLLDFITVVWHRFPCWAIDEYIPLQHASFVHPQPKHSAFYEELFQCDVSFGQPNNGLSFSKRYLSAPIRRSGAELEAWLRDSPADLLYMPGRDSSVHKHIKSKLVQALQGEMRFPPFERICETLHMSPQVVRRRLAEEGASYQKIKDAVRCDLVQELLANPDMAIADIAQRAGFNEPAALTRAFKKWTGMTPAQYRSEQANNTLRGPAGL